MYATEHMNMYIGLTAVNIRYILYKGLKTDILHPEKYTDPEEVDVLI